MRNLRGEAEMALAPSFSTSPAPRERPRRRRLERLVETEILPRLLASHPPGPPLREDAAAATQALLDALLGAEAGNVAAACEEAAAACASESRLMLDVLAPTARRLGALWEEDACDFLTVSHALDRLRVLLCELELRAEPRRRAAPAMLLLTAPGETHAFGADMAAELFRRDGWEVERADSRGLRLFAKRRFAALGVSCSCERALADLPGFLAAARAQTCATQAPIILGGALFLDAPALAGEIGADFAATDSEATRRISRALLERRQNRQL